MIGFRLVYPYDSRNIYYDDNILNVVKKCYRELLRKHPNVNTKYFCIMNINTGAISNFAIDTSKKRKRDEKMRDINEKMNEKDRYIEKLENKLAQKEELEIEELEKKEIMKRKKDKKIDIKSQKHNKISYCNIL